MFTCLHASLLLVSPCQPMKDTESSRRLENADQSVHTWTPAPVSTIHSSKLASQLCTAAASVPCPSWSSASFTLTIPIEDGLPPPAPLQRTSDILFFAAVFSSGAPFFWAFF
uniref:Uncharacterized protein n=1 Tax=Phytophthora fragariae TaxID=53985 RepID=A0A6A3D7M1_9STRA|nr:hypothetical protein PF009_g32164 [Phytophthora fragariae]